MPNKLNTLSDLRVHLLHLLDDVFGPNGDRAELVQQKMAYQFNPHRKVVQSKGLWFEVVLNHARLSYVRSTMAMTRQANQGVLHLGDNRTKRSLRPHMPPPGNDICQFCHLKQSALFISSLLLNDKDYALVVNPRPWGHHNFMLVTNDPEPQAMSRENLRNSFELIRILGSEYEAIFTGVQAGASVYHFHLQIHKGSAAIWKNLEQGNIQLKPFFSAAGVTASYAERWPACVFAFESSDLDALANVVSSMIETFVKGENDFPYNIGFRTQGDVIRLLLFPRTGEEQPACMEGHPDSWGRFGFLELGGSVFLLTPEAYEAVGESGREIYEAIASTSISPSESSKLISDFRTLAGDYI